MSEQLQRTLRDSFLSLLDGLPKPAGVPAVRSAGRIEGEGYTVEKLAYASLPDYHQVNLSVVQKVDTGLFKGLELRLDVVNLLDEKYQIRSGTGVGVGAPQFGPRRALFAGLTQRF